MSLKDIVKQLKLARATASLELNTVDPRNRSGVEGRIRQAEREIGELEQAYRDVVLEKLAIVGIVGPKSAEFARFAASKMLCVDGAMLVNQIAESIEGRISGYHGFGGQELNALLGELNEVKARYGILSIPPIQDNDLSRIVASMPLKAAVNKILRTNYGLQLHSAVIRRHVADIALTEMFDAPGRLVVAIFNFEGVDTQILPSPSLILEPTGEITAESVAEDIKTFQTALGGNKRGKSAPKEGKANVQ
jgi:hypothetical protein